MRGAKASGAPLRYYGGKTAEADEKRGVVKDIEGRAAAQDFSGEEPRDLGADHAGCSICPHACALAEGQTGLCRARVAEGGQVVDANGNPIDGCTVNEDGNVVDAYMNVIDPYTGQPAQ